MTDNTNKPSNTSYTTTTLLVCIIFGVTLFLQHAFSLRQALLFIIGTGIGICLLHAMFGFSGAWRKFIRERQSDGIRAQLILLGLTSSIFFPLIANGGIEGLNAQGAIAPLGYALIAGAFLFGIGMQLGGGCGSGTLFTAGQGQVDMLITLTFFIIGATFASSHLDWWWQLGDTGSIVLIEQFSWPLALLMQLAVLLILYRVVLSFDKRRRTPKSLSFMTNSQPRINTFLFGPWPLLWAVIGLVIFNLLTLLIAGHPWSITFAFSLWGAKIWSGLAGLWGSDISQWQYWQLDYPASALNQSVLADITSVMNFGLILGAALAASLAAKFAPAMKLPGKKILIVMLGGLLLGYGARVGFGCNIGALLAGISSSSVHGWVWLVAAFIGNIVGVQIRIIVKLDSPVTENK